MSGIIQTLIGSYAAPASGGGGSGGTPTTVDYQDAAFTIVTSYSTYVPTITSSNQITFNVNVSSKKYTTYLPMTIGTGNVSYTSSLKLTNASNIGSCDIESFICNFAQTTGFWTAPAVSGGGYSPASLTATTSYTYTTSNRAIGCHFLSGGNTSVALYLFEVHNGVRYTSTAIPVSASYNTLHPYKVSIDRSVGTYGTAYLQLYTDATYSTTSGSAVSLALHDVADYDSFRPIVTVFRNTPKNMQGYIYESVVTV